MAVKCIKIRLGIKRFQMGRPARHTKMDDAFRTRRKMQPTLTLEKRDRTAGIRAEQLGQRHSADTSETFLQKRPAAEVLLEALELVDERMLHGSVTGDGFVEIEDNAAKLRPSSKLGGILTHTGIGEAGFQEGHRVVRFGFVEIALRR